MVKAALHGLLECPVFAVATRSLILQQAWQPTMQLFIFISVAAGRCSFRQRLLRIWMILVVIDS